MDLFDLRCRDQGLPERLRKGFWPLCFGLGLCPLRLPFALLLRQILDRGHLLRVRDCGHRQKSRLVGVKAALDRSRLGLGAEGRHLCGAPQREPIKPELPGGRAFPTFPSMAAAVSPAAFKRFTLEPLEAPASPWPNGPIQRCARCAPRPTNPPGAGSRRSPTSGPSGPPIRPPLQR